MVSADIKQKKEYEENINAWLKRPSLGMIPIFMAGDKLYFHYYNKLMKQMSINLAVSCGNTFEKTDFKSGFCGVFNKQFGKGNSWRPYDISIYKKGKIASYFGKEIISNPGYWNASLFDNIIGFYASYISKHNLLWLYDYIEWDEAEIKEELTKGYDWEGAKIRTRLASWRRNGCFTTISIIGHVVLASLIFFVPTKLARLYLYARIAGKRIFPVRQSQHLIIGFDFDRAMAVIDEIECLY